MVNHDFDVIIIGAGLSGICAAHHLSEKCPDKNFAILEGRNDIGGTWDLFKYPGIRTDSDMATYGYVFKPWVGTNQFVDAPMIKKYLTETIEEDGTKEKIIFNTWVEQAEWSSKNKCWTLITQNKKTGYKSKMTANFIISCCGYYDHQQGYIPDYKNVKDFKGTFIHPQFWPEDLDYKDKNIIIIGSGATAVTLVPSLINGGARHVKLLQRSPSYFVILPREDNTVNRLSKVMPVEMAHQLTRWKNIKVGEIATTFALKYPRIAKLVFINGIKSALPKDYDIDKHFTPKYYPMEQRMCVAPDGDFFKAISSGKASMVTDHIDCFTEEGIQLKTGKVMKADIIVSATGLKMVLAGGIKLYVDGNKIDPKDQIAYKSGVMMSDVPNFAAIFGYTTFPWTIKADFASKYLCQLINYMDQNYFTAAMVSKPKLAENPQPFITTMNSGYIKRGINEFPKQGSSFPWKISQNMNEDKKLFENGKVNDGHLKFYKFDEEMPTFEDVTTKKQSAYIN
ncbi:MAG: NAD(P)/FAD-dependent oxidoreductase [Bacteroidetes bacterium]|nr:NAD(P)/FAD-dependent oxidoreductase [Bacteroidota bacterium]